MQEVKDFVFDNWGLVLGFLLLFLIVIVVFKEKIVELWEHYFWSKIIPLLVLLVSIASIFYVSSYFVEDQKISLILKDIGSVIIAGAVFQFILKSKGFIKVLDETLDHSKRHWKKYNFSYIKTLLQKIKETHTFFEFTFDKAKYESINAARDKYLAMTKDARLGSRTEEHEALLRRNFFIKEITNTRTIYKNGSEIATFEAYVEIIRDGEFKFNYKVSVSNEKNEYPDFQEFISNDGSGRFTDFSFSAKVLDLPEKLNQSELQIQVVEDSKKTKSIILSLPEFLLRGDTFKLMFSTTTKNEYTEEYLKNLANADNPPASISKYPIGVRNIIVQEEHYAETPDYGYRLNPKVIIDGQEHKKLSESENLFYKTHKWTVYYSETTGGAINLSLV